MRLKDDSVLELFGLNESVDFSPRPGYEEPEDRIRSVIELMNGQIAIKEFGDKRQWSIPLKDISAEDAAIINNWWDDITELVFVIEWRITASTIAFHDNDPAADTITDSGSGLVSAGFASAMHITADGSDNNDGDYVINTVVAGTITLTAAGELVTESAGNSIRIGEHVDNVIIINETQPLQMVFDGGWDNRYEGTLILREA